MGMNSRRRRSFQIWSNFLNDKLGLVLPPFADGMAMPLAFPGVCATLTSSPSNTLGLYGTLHRRAVCADGPFAATAMIYRDPPPVMLRRADVITLFDPEVPSWNHVVVSFDGAPDGHSPDFVVVDIPINSADDCLVQLWRDRIKLARR